MYIIEAPIILKNVILHMAARVHSIGESVWENLKLHATANLLLEKLKVQHYCNILVLG